MALRSSKLRQFFRALRRISNHQPRHVRRAFVEFMESRLLLSSTGALEVWAGNTDLSGTPQLLYSVDQNGYTQLGVTNAQNSAVTFSTGGVHYNYFVIVSRGQIQVDGVQGSDSSYLTTIESTGSTSDGGVDMTGAPSSHPGAFTTIGTSDSSSTFAGFVEFANPNSWTNLTVDTGSMSVMLQGTLESSTYSLPGAASPFNYLVDFRVEDDGLITSAQVQNPSGAVYPLALFPGSGDNNESWDFRNSFSSPANLSAAFPDGTYTVVLNSPVGTTMTQFSYTAPTQAPIPTMVGIADGATGISTSPTFNWNAISDSNPDDRIRLEIKNGNSLLTKEYFGTSSTTTGAISLSASSDYQLQLQLESSSSEGTNADGFAFGTSQEHETDLVFRTAGTAGTAPTLTLTSIGTPGGTINPGDWIEVPIGGFSDLGGNAFGTSSGTVVPVQDEIVLAATKTWGAIGNIVLSQSPIPAPIAAGFNGASSSPTGGSFAALIPSSVTPGTYWVGANLDSTGAIAGNTGNPIAWSPTQITITANPVAGDTLVLVGTQAQPSTLARLTFAASGNTLVLEDFLHAPPGFAETDNYIYTQTGASTATLFDTTEDFTIQLTFATSSSGTAYDIDPNPEDGGNGFAQFYLAPTPTQSPAPSNPGGDGLQLNVAGGAGTQYNTSGAYGLALNANGTFNLAFNGSNLSSGSYSYTQTLGTSPGIAEVVMNVPSQPTEYLYLVFTSNTGGTFYNTDLTASNDLNDFDYGTFDFSSFVLNGPMTIASSATIGAISGNGALTVNSGVTLTLAPGSGVSQLASLTLLGTAKLDIYDNTLIVNYGVGNPSPVASIGLLIKSGYNNAAFNGPGIISSKVASVNAAHANTHLFAIGYADASDPAVAADHFAAGTVVIKPALVGDANLDGKVNFSDFLLLSASFNGTNTSWDQADFNYAGKTNFGDFLFLSANFNNSTPLDNAATPSPAILPAQKSIAAVTAGTTSSIAPAGTFSQIPITNPLLDTESNSNFFAKLPPTK